MSRLWLALALLAIADAGVGQQRTLGATATDNAAVFRGQVGRRVTYVCPARLNMSADVWGTDVYTDDSPLCLSAVHAGALTAGKAGAVTVVIGGNVASFQGSTRNGVTSKSYASYPNSMKFDSSGPPGVVDWTTTGEKLPPEVTGPVVVSCPQRGSTAGGVWGTDVYSEDSAICVAAVHAGVITLANGGPVAVTALPSASSFTGSARNGVTSQSYATAYLSFRVSAPGAAGPSSGGTSSTGNVSGINVAVSAATATVRWNAVAGATSYFVTRWKVGDAACCNSLSPPGAQITATQWARRSCETPASAFPAGRRR